MRTLNSQHARLLAQTQLEIKSVARQYAPPTRCPCELAHAVHYNISCMYDVSRLTSERAQALLCMAVKRSLPQRRKCRKGRRDAVGSHG